MKPAQLRKMIDQKPFRPFALETQGGTWIPIPDQSAVRISPFSPHMIVVFEADGTVTMVEPNAVTATKSL